MRSENERGEGKLGSVVGLAFLAAVLWAGWNLIPVYYANYSMDDRLVELARVPKYRYSDAEVMRLLVKAAAEHNIEQYVNETTCRVTTTEHRRTIGCEYERTVNVLPGWTRTFQFKLNADQPVL